MRAAARVILVAFVVWQARGLCGEPGGPADMKTICRNARDYTYMWWTHGLRDARKVFSIQTSRFALSFDAERLELTHLLPLAEAPPEARALVQENGAVFGEPNASLRCVIEAAGRRYRATGGSRDFKDCHLVESGRFFQRRWLDKIAWQQGAPKTESGFEIAAWPDRLVLLLRVKPSAGIRGGALEVMLDLDERYGKTVGHRDVLGLAAADGTGFVAVSAEAGGALTCNSARGELTVRLEVGDWAAGVEKTVGLVVYPAARGTSSLLESVARAEKSPLEVTARQIAPAEAKLAVAYDRAMGWHRVGLRNDGKTRGYHDSSNDRIERVALALRNPSSAPREVRLNFAKDGRVFGITGLSAMLRDTGGDPTGIPVQLSKNWHKGKRPERYQGSWYHGLTMLTVPARTTLELEYTSVNALWGGVPAASHAQLCLVGWGNNQLWEEAAIGSWGESLCFEPDQGQRGGAVLDTRPLMVWGMGDKPKKKWGWTHNVGGADFLVYYDAPRRPSTGSGRPERVEGRKQWSSRMRTTYRRCCPVLTEVVYAGRSHDGKIDLGYTVSLYRTDDITRGVYSFRYDVRRPVTFDRLVLFQCGGDHYSYTGERRFAIGNERGLVKEWATQWGGNRYKTEPVGLTGRIPWFSMHEAVRRNKDQGAWANRGVVIRHWVAHLAGRWVRPWAAERGAKVRGRDTSLIDIVPPPDVKELRPGDWVQGVVEHIVVPQFAKDYYGPNENLKAALAKHEDTWRMIHREAVGNDLEVKVTRGKFVRGRPTMLRATGNRAEFTVTGGLGYVPITISGLTDHRAPALEMAEGGRWRKVDQSVHGNDFWQTDYDAASGTWEITYSVPLDTPGDERATRSFRFKVGR